MSVVRRLNEQIITLSLLDGSTWYIFPRYSGSAMTSAETIVNGAIRGLELPLQSAFKGSGAKDRNNPDKILVNVKQTLTALPEIVPVPSTITDLYEEPANETDDDREIRLGKIRAYFENR